MSRFFKCRPPRLQGFGRDARGVAAVEFALLVPFLMLVFLGVFEVTQIVRTQTKLAHAAGALAKIVAQQTASVTGGTSGTLGDICSGVSQMMAPGPTSSVGSTIASVTTTITNGSTSVAEDWESDGSCPTSVSAMGASTAKSLAAQYGLIPNSTDSAIIVKMSYVYKPAISYVIGSAVFTLTQTAFVRPRSGTTVSCTNC